MTDRELPFELYETPDPPPQLADGALARIKRGQRAEIVDRAARRQSRKLMAAVAVAFALAVAVVVLLVVKLRDSGSRTDECPVRYAALGGGDSATVDDAPPMPEFRPAAALTLTSQSALAQFESAEVRARAARAIARARRARLAAAAPGQAGQGGAKSFELTDTEVRAALERISVDLFGCFPSDEDGKHNRGVALALSVAGEPGHGSVVEDVALAPIAGLPPDAALSECLTQTLLSLRFPSPRVGGRILVAHAVYPPANEAEEEPVVGASRPRKEEAKGPANDADAAELLGRAREAAKAGRFGEALRLAERVLHWNDKDQDALMVAVIASCNSRAADKAAGYIPRLQSKGRRGMAIEICKKVLGFDPLARSASPNPCHLDEVACLIAKNPPECCKQYAKAERLKDRNDIKNGISGVREQVAACRRGPDDAGLVKVEVSVSSSGKVAKVSVRQAPNDRIGECVAKAVRGAIFVETQQGGSFVYPFVFR